MPMNEIVQHSSMELNYKEPIKIAEGTYWVGVLDSHQGLKCNSYLIVDGKEGMLIDPGSVLDFKYVCEKVKKIIPLERISYIILNHQDPDLCSSVPLFEEDGFIGRIATHWRSSTIIQFYGVRSPFYMVDENNYMLKFSSGKELHFLHTPYLHFPGSIVTYDPTTKILFSSDLYGTFSDEYKLFLGKNQMDAMKIYHEHYMPSNEILRPVMEQFLRMNIELIAPQHGSIIKEDIIEYTKMLRELQCGVFMHPIHKTLNSINGYTGLCNELIKRLEAVFGKTKVIEAFNGSGIALDVENLEIIDFNFTGEVLWNRVLNQIYKEKGVRWLTIVEPFIAKTVSAYGLKRPLLLDSILVDSEKKYTSLADENLELKSDVKELNRNLKEAEDDLIKDHNTGLYNETFFKQYLHEDVAVAAEEERNPVLMYIEIDGISEINLKYGTHFGDEILRNLAILIRDSRNKNHLIFKRNAPGYAYYINNLTKKEAEQYAEEIKNRVRDTERVIEKVTVSIGVVSFDDIYSEDLSSEEIEERMRNTALFRLKVAKGRGANNMCSHSTVESQRKPNGKVLIIDANNASNDILKAAFANQNIFTISANDGMAGMKMIGEEEPDIIISEVMLPKLDGFLIKERLRGDSNLERIPFILISHKKDQNSIKRADYLDIDYYFKKPYYLTEIVGTVKKLIKGEHRL